MDSIASSSMAYVYAAARAVGAARIGPLSTDAVMRAFDASWGATYGEQATLLRDVEDLLVRTARAAAFDGDLPDRPEEEQPVLLRTINL